MEMSKNHTLLSLAFGYEDGEEFDLVDGQDLDLTEDEDLENREIMSNIASSEDYYSFVNPYANAIHNATQLFLTSHKSFESFVGALSNESFMQPFKGTNSYDMIVASAIDNIGNMMKHYPISVEDYSLNQLVANIALEDYNVSNEGVAGTATTSVISRLANLGSAGWGRIKSWGEAISAAYKALKAAIAKKDWAAVRAIKGFITRSKRYAKDPKKMFPRLIPGNKAKKIAAVNEKRYIKNMPKRIRRTTGESKAARNAVKFRSDRLAHNKEVNKGLKEVSGKDYNKLLGQFRAEGDTRPLYKRIAKNQMKKGVPGVQAMKNSLKTVGNMADQGKARFVPRAQ